MAPHIHHVDGRILIGLASDPHLRPWIEAYVPLQYLRYHAVLDAWELDEAFEPLVARIVGASYGRVCRACGQGTPCRSWLDHAQRRLEAAWNANAAVWEYVWHARGRRPLEAEEEDRTETEVDLHEAAEELGLRWPCTPTQLRRAFVRRALKAHPDQGGDDAAMRRAIRAREALSAALEDG